MIDWSRIVGFDWDKGNLRKNTEKHGVSQFEAEQVFFNSPLLIVPDEKHSEKEPRYHALGQTSENRYLHVTFTLRKKGTLLRVISVRNMHKKERGVYEQK